MTETEFFTHKFGGWKEARARRWKNTNGSECGIVAENASVPANVTIPAGCVVWPSAKISAEGASIGYRASIGEGASIGKDASIEFNDWMFVAGPLARRAVATLGRPPFIPPNTDCDGGSGASTEFRPTGSWRGSKANTAPAVAATTIAISSRLSLPILASLAPRPMPNLPNPSRHDLEGLKNVPLI